MTELNELIYKKGYFYSKEHTWVKKDKDKVIIGISDYAQDQLGEIIYIQLPEIGEIFKKGNDFGFVESTKSVSDLYIPLAGEVISVNTELEETPEKINEDPFGKGWMIKILPYNQKEIEQLMKASEYKYHIGGKKD